MIGSIMPAIEHSSAVTTNDHGAYIANLNMKLSRGSVGRGQSAPSPARVALQKAMRQSERNAPRSESLEAF